MKSLAKLSLLLALVVAGRYLRPTATSASAPQAQAALVSTTPDTSAFTAFAPEPTLPVAPVNQRLVPVVSRPAPDSLAWF